MVLVLEWIKVVNFLRLDRLIEESFLFEFVAIFACKEGTIWMKTCVMFPMILGMLVGVILGVCCEGKRNFDG